MARPKKKNSELRADTLRIRLTDAERKALDQAAAAEHLPETSTWARSVLLTRAAEIASRK